MPKALGHPNTFKRLLRLLSSDGRQREVYFTSLRNELMMEREKSARNQLFGYFTEPIAEDSGLNQTVTGIQKFRVFFLRISN